MVDIHSHILPKIDDGASSVDESAKLLKELKKQGIDFVFATPHFYPMETTLEDFLSKREESFKILNSYKKIDTLPKVFLGAEVFYFSGIGKSNDVKKLHLENTEYLLLELSNSDINRCVLADIKAIKENLKLTPIIAHIERYSNEKGFKDLLKLIKDGVCLAQVNTASFLFKPYDKITKKLIKKGYISFIASDAHSINGRPPRFDEAKTVLEDKKLINQYSLIIEKSKDLIKLIKGNGDEE